MLTPEEALDQLTTSMMINDDIVSYSTPISESGPYLLTIYSPNDSVGESNQKLFTQHGFSGEVIDITRLSSETVEVRYKHQVKLQFVAAE